MNVIIAASVSMLIAIASITLAVGVFVFSLVAIYFRGHLVPGTPTLTKQYFPERVLRWFDKGSTTPTTDEIIKINPESILVNAGVVEPCREDTDLCLTAEFQEAWRKCITSRIHEPAEDRLAGALNVSNENSFATRTERRLRNHITALLDTLADVTDRSLPQPEQPDGPSVESRFVTRLAAALPALAPDARDNPAPTDSERRDPRVTAVRIATLCSLAAGVLLRAAAPFLVAVVGAGIAWYVRERDPPPVSLDVAREISDSSPSRGDEVDVRVTVRNSGSRFVPDLRLADGVPSGLRVVEGSPHHATALAPGRGAEFSYTVRVLRGEHQFDPITAESRGFTSASSNNTTAEAIGDELITCLPAFTSAGKIPLRERTTAHVGRNVTDTAGAGIEFNAIREYQPGDPLSRVDWNRLGRTGRLATLQFSEERAARVFLVVDARAVAHRAHEPDAPSAVERSVEAAGRVATSLFDENERVGLTAIAPVDCWLASGTSREHRLRLEQMLATHPALTFAPPSETFLPTVQRDRLRRRIPGDAQLIVLSPLLDSYIVNLIHGLDALGTPATIISPIRQQLARSANSSP